MFVVAFVCKSINHGLVQLIKALQLLHPYCAVVNCSSQLSRLYIADRILATAGGGTISEV